MRNDHTDQIFEAVGRELNSDAASTLYDQTRDLLEQQINKRQLKPGDRIPSQRQLSKLWGISEVTVRRAMQALAARGLIRSRAGSGTIVIGPPQHADENTPATPSAIRSVGIVFSGISDGYPFIQPMLEGLESACDGQLAMQMIDYASLSVTNEDTEPAFLSGVDALILESPVNLSLIMACQRKAIPYVLQYSDLADGCSRCVVVNYTTGVLQAINHLVQHRNRKSIALVLAKQQRFSTGKLMDAFGVARMMYDLPFNEAWIKYAGYQEADGYDATIELLSQPEKPDAIIYASDFQARGGLIAAQESGVDVPGSLSIIGTGKLLREREWPVQLSTIDICFNEVGRHTMALLNGLAAHQADTPLRCSVFSRFIPGQTS